MTLDVIAILGGFALMILGSYVLVGGASNMARYFGVSDLVIGATIVALGTSLPELLAVIVASAQGKAGIGLGNIVGSNIINVIGILGLGVIIMPIAVTRSEVSPTTIIAFIAASAYLLFCLLFRDKITRIDGLIMLTAFVLYSWFSYSIKPGQ
jgi:cation:H+ antiporter